MNRISLPLAAALMLGVSSLAPPAFAQDAPEKPSAAEKSAPANGGGDQRPSADRGGSAGKDGASMKQESAGRDGGKDSKESKASDNNKASDKSDRKAADDRQAPPRDKSADRDDKPATKSSEGKPDREPAKKADRDDKPSSKSSETTKSDEPATKSSDAKKQDDGPRGADSGKADDTKRSADDATKSRDKEKAKTADLSGDKKGRVATSFKRQGVKEITNVNIDIHIGNRLPRDWHYHPVPDTVIEIVPEYRGYHFVYVEDRYVIVDPDTYEVVYVIEDVGSGSASYGRSTGESGSGKSHCSTDLTFTQEDRHFIIEKVRRSEVTVKIGDLEIGAALPSDIKVETFPSEVTTRVTTLGDCRYVVVEDKVAVVDPDDEKIVAIIED